MARALLIGHSHVHAPADTIREKSLDLDAIAFWVEPGAIEKTSDGLRFREDIATRIAIHRPIYSFIGGNAHTVLGLVDYHRGFDFVLPEAPHLPLDPERELVSAEVIRHALATVDEGTMPILELLVRMAPGRVMHVCPPPPVFLADATREKYPWNMTPDQPRAFAPAWVRYKIWLLSVSMIADRVRKMGIPFVMVPASCQDENGFLREEFRRDVAHANGRYGALILEKLGLLS
jgi:hypothetical protein